MIGKLREILAKPFPQEESIYETLGLAGGISLFVVLFLYVFKPFGIHTQESGLFLLCLGFGMATFIASIIYEFIVVRIFKFKGAGTNFTFLRWIFYFLGVMLFISLANFIFVRIALFDDIQWSLFPYMIRGTFAVGVFPVILFGALALLRQERKYQNIAKEFEQYESPSSRQKQHAGHKVFDIPAERIQFIEAMQNYIKIHFVNAEGGQEVSTQRATLIGISDYAEGKSIGGLLIRCHRSFFVNREFISEVSGNAQGLTLSLVGGIKKIPVSRSYLSVFRNG